MFWCFFLLQLFRPKGLSSANQISNGGPNSDQRLYKIDLVYEFDLSRLRQNEVSNKKKCVLFLSLHQTFDVFLLGVLQSQQDRVRVLQRQQGRLHKGGLAHRNVNVLKESVGTGVFHPLQRPTSETVVTSIEKRSKQLHLSSSSSSLIAFFRYVLCWYNIYTHMNDHTKRTDLTLFFTCQIKVKGS